MQLNNPHLLTNKAYIDGKWRDAESGAVFTVTNPATGVTLASVPDMGVAETRAAIEAAERALPAWKKRSGLARAQLLRKWYELIVAATDDIARIMTAEQGKPLAEARGEVAYAASFVEWFAEEGRRVYGDTMPAPASDKRIVVVKQPVGVCAAITPWNFPAAMITRKVAPALAAGCTILVKPAEYTPLTALALARLAEQAGIPAGVFNVITAARASAPAVGKELTANPIVRKLSFTGSTGIGRLLMAESAPTLKKLSLELGGNAPFIVFDDADLDIAVESAMASKFRNNGQTCVCANRLLVQSGIYEAFTEKLTAKVRTLKVGNGAEAGVTQGPLIDIAALEKVEAQVADAVAKGGRILTGGQRHASGGTFYEPTVIANATAEMRCAREETFGPVAPVFRFETDAEAIALANDTEFGLASYFFSQNLNRVIQVAEALEYGMVGINTGLISNEVAPFGGIKQSGFGREGSKYGIEEYLVIKQMCIGLA
ncbi:MAG: NAD-dependent succinate-semialdehyde dehydrogenase [Zoogloeaceae bacterium]|jgi:succinate-semialdehyde dehydrogenase/glutarate-semialdehyde dehydrogenase|nr:NAD-dependent succinate-semialdehyde dehydrogenase [Zoogloeaceae bacterium]